jgi:hypothetical protein
MDGRSTHSFWKKLVDKQLHIDLNQAAIYNQLYRVIARSV